MFFNLTRNSALLYKTTDVIDTFVYRSLKVYSDIGMSSAVSFYQSIVGFIFIYLCNSITKKFNSGIGLF